MGRKGIKNLTYIQRMQIEALMNQNVPKSVIAERVGINIRTLYYELKKGAYEHKIIKKSFWYGDKIKYIKKYSADISQQRYDILCSARGRPIKLGKDFEFVRYIEKRVKEDNISPIAVLGQIKHKGLKFDTDISKTTLYRYIKLGFFNGVKLEKRKERYKKVVVKRVSKGTSIEKRPIEVSARNTFGNWEMDCVCGSSLATLLVLTERMTRKEIIFKMNDQKGISVVKCLNKLEYRFGKNFKKIFKTITVDNGSEFQCFENLEKSIFGHGGKRTKIYYCHPYCSCERGTNERMNREIRRIIPKGSNINNYSDDDIIHVENWLNNFPRGVLGYATANELFDEQLSILC